MHTVTVTKDNFQTEVLQAETDVIVDFWAVWCGPCRAQSPILNELAQEEAGRVKICKVNVDEEPELAAHFQITGIPTLLVFRKGQLIETLVGLRSKADLAKVLGL